MPRRRADRIDENQPDIVKLLLTIPGVSVEVGHDDILVGYRGQNFWYEIKNPDVANKQGKVRESAKKDSQKELEKSWTGHYRIVTTIDEILEDIFNVSVLWNLPITPEEPKSVAEALKKISEVE